MKYFVKYYSDGGVAATISTNTPDAFADIADYTEVGSLPVTAEEVRAERNALLLASDADWALCTSLLWSLGSYSSWKSNTHCQNWAEYRQALRDVPAQSGFPGNVVWPTKPLL